MSNVQINYLIKQASFKISYKITVIAQTFLLTCYINSLIPLTFVTNVEPGEWHQLV